MGETEAAVHTDLLFLKNWEAGICRAQVWGPSEQTPPPQDRPELIWLGSDLEGGLRRVGKTSRCISHTFQPSSPDLWKLRPGG